MKFTCMKWSALPILVLMAGTVALAKDLSSADSQQPDEAQSGSPATAATPAAAPTPEAKPKPTVARRKENQQDRIAQGVKSGQLTPGETSKLESKEAALNAETKADRAAKGGKRRAAEKKQTLEAQSDVAMLICTALVHFVAGIVLGASVVLGLADLLDRDAQGIKSG